MYPAPPNHVRNAIIVGILRTLGPSYATVSPCAASWPPKSKSWPSPPPPPAKPNTRDAVVKTSPNRNTNMNRFNSQSDPENIFYHFLFDGPGLNLITGLHMIYAATGPGLQFTLQQVGKCTAEDMANRGVAI